MSAAHPTFSDPDEIPASRLMRERSEARDEVARLRAQNDALRFERDAMQARAALARADLRTLQTFVVGCWEETHQTSKPNLATIRQMLDELLAGDVAGLECPDCDGAKSVRDEIPDEFGVQIHDHDCESCDGTGRVPR